MFVYRYSDDEPIFNEIEENDLLEDCDYEFEEFDQAKADLNLKQNKFHYVPESEGIGE